MDMAYSDPKSQTLHSLTSSSESMLWPTGPHFRLQDQLAHDDAHHEEEHDQGHCAGTQPLLFLDSSWGMLRWHHVTLPHPQPVILLEPDENSHFKSGYKEKFEKSRRKCVRLQVMDLGKKKKKIWLSIMIIWLSDITIHVLALIFISPNPYWTAESSELQHASFPAAGGGGVNSPLEEQPTVVLPLASAESATAAFVNHVWFVCVRMPSSQT